MNAKLIASMLALGSATAFVCPTSLTQAVADMHDGDQKRIVVDGTSLTITPFANNETWTISSTIDSNTCSAMVDFDVPGKPGPPPVPLLATFVSVAKATDEFQCNDAASCVYWVEYTDPSGTLAAPSYPLNVWVAE